VLPDSPPGVVWRPVQPGCECTATGHPNEYNMSRNEEDTAESDS
jgi:hypothetical protein